MASRRNAQDELIAAQQATIVELRALVAEMRTALEQMSAAAAAREAELEALRRRAFGQSSEKMPPPATELRKGRAPEANAALAQKKRKQNEQRKNELETEVVAHAVPEAGRVCPTCEGRALTVSVLVERVDYGYVPGYFRRRVHRQEVLVCSCCDTSVVAPAPARPFEKSPYGAGLIAHILVQKCACSVPIYRLEKQFQWLGIPLSHRTLNDLFHAAAQKLKPLYLRLLHRVAHADIVLADETTLKM